MATFFTADTHFGDEHILRLRGRLFPTVEAHDEALIARWNEAVGEGDEVWHVGDFANGATREHVAAVFARLNGRKRLVRGNHDTNRVLELPWAEAPVESIRLSLRGSGGAEVRVFLAHYAHRAWPGLWRGARHLYGHTHGQIPDTLRSCDVGVDAWDYRPVTLAEAIARQDAATIVPDELVVTARRRPERAAANDDISPRDERGGMS